MSGSTKPRSSPCSCVTSKAAGTAGLGDQAYTYDWRSKKFDLPLSARVGKVPKLGGQTVNVFAQPFYNIDHGSAGSQDYGLKVNLTFLLPDVRLGFPPASTDGSKGS